MNENNIHSVANFNPGEYEVLDYLDNQRPRYAGQPVQFWQEEIKQWEGIQLNLKLFSTCTSSGL